MDPLTHTLFGATLADTGLARRRAIGAVTLVVGANLPDVDVLSYVHGADYALGFRRGWTHGILALVLWPPILTGLVLAGERLWRRYFPGGTASDPRWLLGLSAIGVVSHPLLDWLNTYGVRFWMPFSGRWFYGDTLFIVDPWLWLLLGGVLFLGHSASWRARWRWAGLAVVASAVILAGPGAGSWTRAVWGAVLVGLLAWRWRHGSRPSPRRARWALALMALYVLGMHGAMRWAVADIRTQLADHGVDAAAEVMVGPLPAQLIRRMVVISGPEGYRTGTYDLFASSRLALSAEEIPRNMDPPAARAAVAAPCLAGMVTWLRFPYAESRPLDEGQTLVLLHDARYTPLATGGFGTDSVVLDAHLAPQCEAP